MSGQKNFNKMRVLEIGLLNVLRFKPTVDSNYYSLRQSIATGPCKNSYLKDPFRNMQETIVFSFNF